MPYKPITLAFSLLLFFQQVSAQGSFTRTPEGVLISPDKVLSHNTSAVKLSVIADNIIRVTSTPMTPIVSADSSLITLYKPDTAVKWTLSSTTTHIILKTRLLTATASIATGAISFSDPAGRSILAEKEGGRSFEPAVFDGQPFYQVRQTFVTAPGEAIYGLGQHQDGLMNYKGHRIDLFQNNTEVAVPFLVSDKNYGILWDNYSLTAVGDIRTYQPLSGLHLYSAKGEQGWLTATFRNNIAHPSGNDLQLPSSDIAYTYLGDSKKLLPASFTPANGSVTWEGAVSSETPGTHVFRMTYAGYVKVFIDGQLRLDRWRQAWNPGSAFIDLSMEKDKKVSIKIVWEPDGDESYLSLKWLPPIPAEQKDDISFSSEAGHRSDYYFVYGKNIDEVIAGYRSLTGKAAMVPKWAMGLWQSRERYKTQQEVLSTVQEFRKRKIPLDNIVQDWSYWPQDEWGSQDFDAGRFPSPDSLIKALHHTYHSHFMISVWPKFYEGITAYNEFNSKGWLYGRNIADRQRDWIGKGYVSTFYDAFNPAARKGFWDLINKKIFSKGVDAWWMDASEPDILSNVSPEKRKEQMTPTALGPAAGVLNAYPMENAKGIYEGQRAVSPDQRVFILTRSGFAGSQHYGAAIWSGDIASRWSDMKDQIAAGVNFSMSGIPYWTMDIGGFATEHRYQEQRPEHMEEWREQMTRWYQFGAFCPLFRVHGQFPYREIYNVAPEDHPAYRSMLYYDRLRYRLLPYLYSIAGMVWREDYTMMRGLVMDFGSDDKVKEINDEYMLGPSLLIAPVTRHQAVNREVYLPSGQGWYDLYTGRYTAGGQSISADAPYQRMPVFVKEGSILPLGPDLQYTDQKPADTITLFIYTGKDSRYTLYEDDGASYDYEKGVYATTPLSYLDGSGTLTIGQREGAFPHMLQQRVFRIIRVSKEKPAPLDAAPVQIIKYTGKSVRVTVRP